MKRIPKIFLSILAWGALYLSVSAQEPWVVAERESSKLSIVLFDEEVQQEGMQIYSNSCVSCHGNPSQGNFTPMSPPPGDMATLQFQQQSDGDLFFKIQKGRGAMPSFENTFSESEIWSLVAFIRNFHPNYKQAMPNLEGVVISKLSLSIGFDENVDKLVVKVTGDDNTMVPDVSVKAFIKGMFGNYLLGNAQTNNLGIAYFDVDSKIPGDAEGYIEVIVKASKGFGTAKKEEKIQAAAPTIKVSAIEGRHLWSRAKKAPLWMIITFNLIGIGTWGAIIYIVIGLRKIKKLQ